MKKIVLVSITLLIALSYMFTALSFGNIVIDGYFDDWEDKPHSEIWNGKYDAEEAYSVALFSDNDNLYIHVIYCEDEADADFEGFNFHLKFNNQNNDKYNLLIRPDGDGDMAGTASVYYKNGVVGQGQYVVGGDENGVERTQVEYCIPLANLVDDPSYIKEISLKIPPFGKQEIIHSGISSGPFVIILLGFGIAIIGYLTWRRRGEAPPIKQ